MRSAAHLGLRSSARLLDVHTQLFTAVPPFRGSRASMTKHSTRVSKLLPSSHGTATARASNSLFLQAHQSGRFSQDTRQPHIPTPPGRIVDEQDSELRVEPREDVRLHTSRYAPDWYLFHHVWLGDLPTKHSRNNSQRCSAGRCRFDQAPASDWSSQRK